MEPRLKQHKSSEDRVVHDWLSEMPDELIVHILSFLPTLDAVRTVLLRRFGTLWTLVPNLNFDYLNFCTMLPVNYKSLSGESFAQFSLFVRSVLMFHRRCTLNKFRLCLMFEGFDNDKVDNDIRLWLSFALRREVKELQFNTWCYYHSEIKCFNSLMPVFTSDSLAVIHLKGCIIESQHQFRLRCLKKLILFCVRMSDEAFQLLLCGCPEVHLTSPGDLRNLRFISPTVEMLYLCHNNLTENTPFLLDCPYIKTFDLDLTASLPKVADVSSVRELNIMNFGAYNGAEDEVAKVLEKFADATVFKLSARSSQRFLFSVMDVDLPESRWKQVVLKIKHNSKICVLGVIRLLRSLSHLEELKIYPEQGSEYRGDLDCEELYSCPCVMPCLKTVTMHGYDKPWECHLQLLAFLLRNAVVLEKLVIVSSTSHRLSIVEELEFVKKVSTFQRASPQVVFA